ncbi:MAG: collagenase [Psychrobacillus sp.]
MRTIIKRALCLLFPFVIGAYTVQAFTMYYSWSNLVWSILISCLLFIFYMYYLDTKRDFSLSIVRPPVSFILTATLFCSFYIGGSAWSNFIEEPYKEIAPLAAGAKAEEKKSRKLFSLFSGDSIQKNVESKQIDSISYYFAADNIASVQEYSSLLAKEKAKLDRIFGSELKDPLKIEIYNDSSAIKEVSPGAVGYYKRRNQSIHLMKMDDEKRWERILLHEYTHYRIHQFAKVNGLSSKMEHLPFWFIEGLSEYVGYQDRVINPDLLGETVDYRLLDTNKTIPATLEHYKVYLQGYFTLRKLDSLYGSEIITELLLSESLTDFYNTLERVTGKSTEEFQKTLLSTY